MSSGIGILPKKSIGYFLCTIILAEFGGLNDLADTLKNNKDFEFISFTWDNEETIKRVQRNYQLQFRVFAVDTKECRRLNLNNGFPTTFILNRQGVIKYFHIGGSTDSVKAKEFVMTILLQEIKKGTLAAANSCIGNSRGRRVGHRL